MLPFHKADWSQGCRKHGSHAGAKVVGSLLGDLFLYYFEVKAHREEPIVGHGAHAKPCKSGVHHTHNATNAQ